MLGTRPGGPIAAAWATLQSFGAAGYRELARKRRRRRGSAARRHRADSRARASSASRTRRSSRTPRREPIVRARRSLEARGWTVDRQHAGVDSPDGHREPRGDRRRVPARPAAALAECARIPAREERHAPMYGMAAKMPVRRLVANNVRKVIADLYAPGGAP
jgi:hypothetical protein